jgi:hypothetical protein
MPFVDRQVPATGEIFLDHVGWFLPGIAAAGAFERLGFPLTPYTKHQNADAAGNQAPSGTANRCAMLRRGYLEFLEAVPDMDTPLTQQHHAAVARYAGLHLLAFTCADPAAEERRIAAAGIRTQPLVRLRRPTDVGEARFGVIRAALDEFPEGRVQLLSQETPEVVWQEQFIARDNGIDALLGVVIAVADPGEAAARFGRFLGRAPDGNRILLDRGRLGFVRGGGIVPRMTTVELVSRDLDLTRRFLAGRGVPCAERDGAIAIAASEAAGASLMIYPTTS